MTFRKGTFFNVLHADCLNTGLRSKVLILSIIAVVGAAFPMTGLAKDIPGTREEIQLSFAPLVNRTGPAVVNIFARTQRMERVKSPLFADPFFEQFFGKLFERRPQMRNHQSLGSGVVIKPNGIVVTNNHVIAGATEVKVVFSNRREFDAEILLADKKTDLAILKLDVGLEKLPFIELRDSDTLDVGDLVLAIGNPFGVGQTVTSGIVSALARTAAGITDYSFFIQTDASINPGNSGGALIAMDGRLVGINTAIFSNKRGTGGSVGIGFAVPSNMVKTVVDSVEKGKVVRPWLGATGQTIDPDLAREFELKRPAGVIINKVYPESSAVEAGLKAGDIVLSINKKPIDDRDILRYRIATLPLGKTFSMRVIRNGRPKTLRLVAKAPPTLPKPNVYKVPGRNPFNGAIVANLSPAFALDNGLDDMKRGVVVVSSGGGSVAERLGLKKGDIVLTINSKKISTVKNFKKVVSYRRKLWRISILRDDKVLTTEIPDN
jgi:Do/DeqQ family serine protease